MTNQNLTLAAAANASQNYSVSMEGDALAPRLPHGQRVLVQPAVNADPTTFPAGSILLAITASDPTQPRRFNRPTLFVLNADGDLLGGNGTVTDAGAYIVLGVARQKVNVSP